MTDPESPKPTYPFGDDDIVAEPIRDPKAARVRTTPRRASRAR